MTHPVGELNPPMRLMMTPGPCSIDPRVYRALASPIVGHLDPWFRGCMEETQTLLRQVFQTENRVTFPLSASGSGGIEASVMNSLESGDEAICCVNGMFSQRMHIIAQHAPVTAHLVEAPLGKPVDPEDVRKVAKGRKIKMIGLAQGETSTGVLTDIDPFRKVADECGALLVVDTVASLAAVPLHVDKQRIDICFSGSQKAISAPPGMSPITVSPHAEEVFRNRKSKVQSWYFDLSTAMNYWGKDRLYHHTPPISSDLCAARSHAHLARRRTGESLGTPSHQSARADRRARSHGPADVCGKAERPAGDGDCCENSRWHRRCESARSAS